MVNHSDDRRVVWLFLLLCIQCFSTTSSFSPVQTTYRNERNNLAHSCTSNHYSFSPWRQRYGSILQGKNVGARGLKTTHRMTNESKSTESCFDSQKRRQLFLLSATSVFATSTLTLQQPARAAPPMAVIAEELGYFPVTNRQGETVMVPKRVSRSSSSQAIELAKHLKKSGAVMYGAYWCPHCARQKEILGHEAWDFVKYVECSPKGFDANAKLCDRQAIDGYPTWTFGKTTRLSGEVSLTALAKASGYGGERIREELEENVPAPLGSNACK